MYHFGNDTKGPVPNCTILSLLEKRYNPKQYYSADNCCNKRADNGTAPAYSNPAKNITAQETAYDTYKQIDPETKTATLHNLASQETCQAAKRIEIIRPIINILRLVTSKIHN